MKVFIVHHDTMDYGEVWSVFLTLEDTMNFLECNYTEDGLHVEERESRHDDSFRGEVSTRLSRRAVLYRNGPHLLD
jgi:hypothetical protein